MARPQKLAMLQINQIAKRPPPSGRCFHSVAEDALADEAGEEAVVAEVEVAEAEVGEVEVTEAGGDEAEVFEG